MVKFIKTWSFYFTFFRVVCNDMENGYVADFQVELHEIEGLQPFLTYTIDNFI